jgi:thioesterase domain-containing protein
MHAALIAAAITPAITALTVARHHVANYVKAIRDDQPDQPAKAGLWHVGWSTGSPLAEANARQAAR